MSGFKMDDYVPVNERIEAFYAKHPDGSLQSEIVELTASRVSVKAYAYRSAEDQRPGIGHSSLEIPGSTSFTRGSEIENAETSAWGRAIAALGFEVKRGLSSREEVRNKQPERAQPNQRRADSRTGGATTVQPAPAQYRREELASLMREKGLDLDGVERYAALVGIKEGERATNDQMDALIDAIRGHGTDAVIEPDAGVPTSSVESSEPEGIPLPSGAPPKPGTDEYRALAVNDKAKARAYWATHSEPEQESLAELMGAPA